MESGAMGGPPGPEQISVMLSSMQWGSRMGAGSIKPRNVTRKEFFPYNARLFLRCLQIIMSPASIRIRRQKALTWGDTIFNWRRLMALGEVLIRYRNPVRFGDKLILDSVVPPFPSSAFDQRIANHVNNLDMTEIPPGIVSISTTNVCPYSCSFCSTKSRRSDKDDLDEELLKRTVTYLEGMGVPFLIFHGGEPMARFDRLIRLVRHVSDRTTLWMFTTGFGVTADKARDLKESGLFGVWVSLDHYEPAVHNRLRGHPEAFDNVRRAVESFQEAGVYTCLSLVPTDDLEEPENFKRYYELAREMGIAEIRILERKPAGRESCQGVRPHSVVLERLQRELFKDPRYARYPPISGLSTWLEKDRAYGCQCRFEYLFISPRGDVQPCEATEISFGNIKDEGFGAIFDRVVKAFPHACTGCIPMVMFEEIQKYQMQKDQLSTQQQADWATEIMAGFRARGKVPGVYERLWPEYERRVREWRRRAASVHGFTEAVDSTRS